MRKQFIDIASTNYRVLWGTGQGKGTFIIERMTDNKTTLRFTDYVGLQEFKHLERALKQSRYCFDNICNTYQYF